MLLDKLFVITIKEDNLIDILINQLSDQRNFYSVIVSILAAALIGALSLQWYFNYKQIAKIKKDFKIDEMASQISKLKDENNTQVSKLKDEMASQISKLKDENNTKISELNTKIEEQVKISLHNANDYTDYVKHTLSNKY